MPVVKRISKYLLAALFMLAGVNHFIMTDAYLRIMPPYLPAPLFLIYLSGSLEALFGVLLLVQKTSRLAAWGIVLLLIAVYPANVFMAMNAELFSEFNPLLIYLRLPLQFVLMAWALWFTGDDV